MSTSEFIEKAKNIHGNRYDYSLVLYTGNRNKIKIICKEHGIFFQIAGGHLQGNNCKKCSLEDTAKINRLDSSDFINRAKIIHKNKNYDFSNVIYKNNLTKVTIRCQEHGLFEITPFSLLQGSGCRKCGINNRVKILRYTTHEFIEKAKLKHGDKYLYGNVKYKDRNSIVEIYCIKHKNIFTVTASNHLHGQGCPICGSELKSMKLTKTTKQFIESAINKHGSRYKYDKVIYTGSENNVNITCKKHNKTFSIKASNHIDGTGCPICGRESKILATSGKNNCNYIDGMSKIRNAERMSKEGRLWAKTIKNDPEYCDCCGVKFDSDVYKIAHHLDGWANFPEKRYDVNNGVCVCNECHCEFHSKYGKGTNTRHQYLAFKEIRQWAI